jgi:phosphoserine phosphatase
MTHMLVLTAAQGKLDDASVSAAADTTGVAPHWLSPGTACEFRTQDPEILAHVRRRLIDTPVDANIIAVADRRKSLLVADMDSTIINCECIDELADFAGIKPQIAAITERAMRGEIEFEGALRERVGLLKGQPEQILDQVMEKRIRLNQGARTLVTTMARAGAVTALVSGGFTWFTARVAERAGFAHNRANILEVEGGRLTGAVREPILGRQAKRRALIELASANAIPLARTMAIGDGANDLDMIRASGLGIAYRAKPVVAEAAHARLDHSDLVAALHIQGYRETELVLA